MMSTKALWKHKPVEGNYIFAIAKTEQIFFNLQFIIKL